MDILIICLVAFILLLGIIGCFVPIVPGPPISYGALLVFHFFSSYSIDENTLWLMAFVVISVTVFDLWAQIYGVKKFGGTKKAVNGSIIGLIIGIFFLPPFGIIIGPFLGAFIGAMASLNKKQETMKQNSLTPEKSVEIKEQVIIEKPVRKSRLIKTKLQARILSIVIFFVFIFILAVIFSSGGEEIPYLWGAGSLMFTIYIYRTFLKPEDEEAKENSDVNKALKIALGALAGFMVGTMLKLSVSLYIIYIIFQTIPSLW